MKREITEAHREVLRRNIKKAHAVRWAGHKKKEVVKSKRSVGRPKKIVEPNSNGHQAVIGLNDYNSLKEVLHNCALAGLTLTRVPSILETTEVIKNVPLIFFDNESPNLSLSASQTSILTS